MVDSKTFNPTNQLDELWPSKERDRLTQGDEMRDETVSPGAAQIGEIAVSTRGLTKRELFAVMAMQGIVSARGTHGHLDGDGDSTEFAKLSVEFADALIEALEEKK
jgi:hypothetical protein